MAENDNKTLRDSITMLDAKISHIEDTMVDYRELLIKLVKQNNEIVKVVKSFELEPFEDEYQYPVEEDEALDKFRNITELLDKYIKTSKGLKELEKELKKNKDKITPGTVGES